MNELLDTEQSYIQDLGHVVKVWIVGTREFKLKGNGNFSDSGAVYTRENKPRLTLAAEGTIYTSVNSQARISRGLRKP